MSRDEAHRSPAAGRSRAAADPAGPGPITDEEIRPRPPLFTARTDETAGDIRTRGHLDRIGAELLCGMVTALQQLGHRQIVVQLGSLTVVDDDAHAVLADQARRLRADDSVDLRLR